MKHPAEKAEGGEDFAYLVVGQMMSFVFQLNLKNWLRPEIRCYIELKPTLVIEKDHNIHNFT